MKRTSLKRLCLLTIAILFLLPLGATGAMEQRDTSTIRSASPSTIDADRIASDMQSLENLYRYVNSIYYEDVDKDNAFDAMASAMIASLDDPYSFYVPPTEAEDYEEGNTGIYGGIGTYLNKPSPKNNDYNDPKTYMITIVSPFPGSPAERAGLRAGDLISHIDGEKVDEQTSIEASKTLRGEPGTKVSITVYRNGSSFDITLTRERITTPTVDSGVLDGNIGYIILSQYTPQTGSQMLDAVKELEKQDIVGLIIDERNNSGGAVDGALQAANVFLPAGDTLVTIQGRKGTNSDKRYVATDSVRFPEGLPIVILTNGGSASSAEIFAAAMHDNGRATLIGTKTFGKGIVQDVFKFGKGFAQVTTAHYYTPNGENIHGKGIEPDIQVDDTTLEDDQIPAYETLMGDTTLQDFVEAHPEPTIENMERFAEENEDRGIDKTLLSILVRNEYYARMPYADRPIGDLHFDEQLKRAVSFIRTGT